MTSDRTSPRLHPAAQLYAREHRAGLMGRREFLTRATALGVSAGAAAGLIGAPAPVRAESHIRQGGSLKMQMEVMALKDPRTFDFSQIANLQRGTIEYLVEYNNDGTIRGMLLENWSVSDDARIYTLNIRPNVTWNNGDPFTAADVARTIAGWCHRDMPGNSMAARMATLIDPATGQAIDGAVDVVDELTLRIVLPHPDITLIAGMADYPAMIVHGSYDTALGKDNIGTGPFLIETLEVGARCKIVRNPDHTWWGSEIYGGPYLDSLEFIDYGTDAAEWVAALEAGEVDLIYDSVGEFVGVLDGLGHRQSRVTSASTIVIRPNPMATVGDAAPYADKRVRRALAMAVDNAICLELGNGDRGEIARNDHIGPMHPEFADLAPEKPDPAAARALMKEAGFEEYEHELVSIDDAWRRDTADAVAAQLQDAGIPVKRTVVPGETFWENWTNYAFSTTDWNGRPLGVQVWALAYRSGQAWNEFGFAHPDFDALLERALAIADHDERRRITSEMQGILREEGVTIQPYWRNLYRHMRPGIIGADRHLTDEIHAYKFALSA